MYADLEGEMELEEDDSFNDSQERDQDSEEQQTQTQSQTQTQALSQLPPPPDVSRLWGYLQPVNEKLQRIEFWRVNLRYTVGRNTELNKVVLPGPKVSNRHCEIAWDGQDRGSVLVLDLSSNGTFINGQKVGKGLTRILREGNEIAFGTPAPQPSNQFEDYRFIYRHTASGMPTSGFYAFYDVSTELGKGSFATVMKALHRETGVWYAVKMIKDKTNRGNGGNVVKNQAIAREIEIMEALKHPNICELREVFVEEDSPDINLVLELIEGGDLLEYILSRGGLNESESKHITYQLCNAMAYIHSKDITHRDLKPENVLLTRDDPPIVKVADFGLAKLVDSLTMLRTMCGTPSYLAPEVVKQEEKEGYDNLVDSWSVGVIVFSMLTNSSPFIEDSKQTNLKTRIIERIIDWNTLACRDVTDECYDFIEKLLLQDPTERMSLTEALSHPWLRSYVPVFPIPQANFYLPSSNNILNATAGNAGITHNLLGLTMASNPAIPREPSRGGPLQRRSEVLSQAAEGTRTVPQPSDEMIANAQAMEHGNRGKRLRANLSPLGEEEESEGSGSSSNGHTNTRGSNGNTGTRSKRPRLRSEA
ncbi:hypothetical protein D9611_003775 [Ephemerocybe angulata]|uniref:Uncharacterized protein n=1 Tax=Ephemerocybe angulata TaxID=980116 RepID=A0A8H5B5M2_9AGAR|nr:hypothetical protein D9611_003775 [Tulosesus angulatus]